MAALLALGALPAARAMQFPVGLDPHEVATESSNATSTETSSEGLPPLPKVPLVRYSLASYPDAVCNDRSDAAYYFTPSDSGAGAQPWVLYMQGGLWCYDAASCSARWASSPVLMSSSSWPATFDEIGGILSTFPASPWRSANKVFLPYCSSDGWVGNVGASNATFGWAFRGQLIVEATIADLIARHGLGVGADVLFGGCSAGAVGAMLTIDYVAPMLPAGSRLRGLLDSGVMLNMPPYNNATVPLQAQTQQLYSLVNPAARVGSACREAFPAEPWKCLYGAFALQYVQTPYFLNTAQFDSFQLSADLDGNWPRSPSQARALGCKP